MPKIAVGAALAASASDARELIVFFIKSEP
jgi:hypothetical protein